MTVMTTTAGSPFGFTSLSGPDNVLLKEKFSFKFKVQLERFPGVPL